MNDQQIWENIINGDVEALRILHEKYYHQLWLWSSKYIKNDTLAEELVSDCFLKLWNSRQNIVIEKSLKSYLYMMLRNQMVSQSRKSKHEIVTESNQFPDLPDDITINNYDLYAELYSAINKIPEQRRKILELAAFESLTYKEIADRLNISVNTVKTQMGRAYQFLKEELDPHNFLILHFFLKKEKLNKSQS